MVEDSGKLVLSDLLTSASATLLPSLFCSKRELYCEKDPSATH